MNSLSNINNRVGYIYSFPVRMGGYILAAIGVAVLVTRGWGIFGGIILLLVGLYFAVTFAGILIDPASKSVRHYTSYYGLRYGAWKEYPTYSHICVIKKDRKRKRFYQETDTESESPYLFEVYLASRSFRGKVLLEICDNRETAEFRASRYAQDMTASVAEYDPPSRTKPSRERGSNRHQSEGFDDDL